MNLLEMLAGGDEELARALAHQVPPDS